MEIIKKHDERAKPRCEECSMHWRSMFTVEIDGEETHLCGYHYGVKKGYIHEN